MIILESDWFIWINCGKHNICWWKLDFIRIFNSLSLDDSFETFHINWWFIETKFVDFVATWSPEMKVFSAGSDE